MVVHSGRALLIRRGKEPLRGRWVVPGGTVELGETLEDAVAREVHEETGVRVGQVDYISSQPWPFPASLMLGFSAAYESGEPSIGDEELQDVRWFTRTELETAAAEPESDNWDAPGDPGGALALPPRLAIARLLIENWLAATRPEAYR